MLMLLALGVMGTNPAEAIELGPPLARPITRIVSLAPSVTELLFALGVGDNVVGVTRFDDYPPEARLRPKVGGFIDADLEAVMALHPDLVVGIATSGGRSRIDALARFGVHVTILPAARVDDLWTSITHLGQALDRKPAALSLQRQVLAGLREVATQCDADGARRPRTLLVAGHRPLTVAGRGSLIGELLELACGVNVVTRGGAYPILDLEAVQALDPDVVVDFSAAAEGATTPLSEARGLRAVQTGRLVRLHHADPLTRLGPRLAQGVQILAAALRK